MTGQKVGKHTPEQIVRKLREADRLLGERPEISEVAKQLEISEATFHRWRAQYGGLKAQANPSCLAHDHWKLLSPARHWDPRAGVEFSHIPDPEGNFRLNQSGERRARSASWHQIRSWWPAGPRPTRSRAEGERAVAGRGAARPPASSLRQQVVRRVE